MKKVRFEFKKKLNIHRYVLVFYGSRKTKYVYCLNRQELREARAALMKKAPKYAYIEIFKAEHNFQEAWIKD